MRVNQKCANPCDILGIVAKQVYIITYGWDSVLATHCERETREAAQWRS